MRDDAPHAMMLARLDRVTVRSGDVAMLAELSLSISSGAPTAIVGPNGAGKTTLLRLLMGLIEPGEGACEIASHRRAFVFQKPVMLRRSAAGNVAFALRAAGAEATDDRIGRLLDRVGLRMLADRPARRLSGGEQQRLALARALARDPELLLLDEPTASLDPAQTRVVEDVIAAVAADGVKVVVATHDLGQARRLAADVVLLVSGHVAEHAPTATFFNTPASEAARRFIAGDLLI
ncbi:MAG: ATP-binding cassette domain-containing protein [Hyphomicrobiales bacterium]|nr:ATP-binding cassette domain-containing protein [Hyphomicrobiales bacterium]